TVVVKAGRVAGQDRGAGGEGEGEGELDGVEMDGVFRVPEDPLFASSAISLERANPPPGQIHNESLSVCAKDLEDDSVYDIGEMSTDYSTLPYLDQQTSPHSIFRASTLTSDAPAPPKAKDTDTKEREREAERAKGERATIAKKAKKGTLERERERGRQKDRAASRGKSIKERNPYSQIPSSPARSRSQLSGSTIGIQPLPFSHRPPSPSVSGRNTSRRASHARSESLGKIRTAPHTARVRGSSGVSSLPPPPSAGVQRSRVDSTRRSGDTAAMHRLSNAMRDKLSHSMRARDHPDTSSRASRPTRESTRIEEYQRAASPTPSPTSMYIGEYNDGTTLSYHAPASPIAFHPLPPGQVRHTEREREEEREREAPGSPVAQAAQLPVFTPRRVGPSDADIPMSDIPMSDIPMSPSVAQLDRKLDDLTAYRQQSARVPRPSK
ncbi:hypothetical protein KIPB_007663, partial [Kipferlia bialata]